MLAVGVFITHNLLSCYLYAEFCSLTSLLDAFTRLPCLLIYDGPVRFRHGDHTGLTHSGEIHAG